MAIKEVVRLVSGVVDGSLMKLVGFSATVSEALDDGWEEDKS